MEALKRKNSELAVALASVDEVKGQLADAIAMLAQSDEISRQLQVSSPSGNRLLRSMQYLADVLGR